MSNPFAPTLPNLPDIQQGGTIQSSGLGGTIADQIAGFIHAKMVKQEMDAAAADQQAKFAKEAQDIEESKARAKMLGLQGDEAGARKKQLDQNIKAEEHKQEVQQNALQMLGGWQALGGTDQAAAQMHAVNKDPEVGNAFEVLRRDQAQTAAALAQANVQVAQAPGELAKAQNEPTIQGAMAKVLGNPTDAAEVGRGRLGIPDPQTKLNQVTTNFNNLWQTGGFTAGQAAEASGFKLPKGMDPNAKFGGKPTYAATIRGSLAQGQAQQTAAAFAKDMIQQDATIKDFAKTTGGLSSLGRWAYDPTHNSFVASAANAALPADQQGLLNAGTAFAQAWKKMIDGARAAPGDLKMTFNMAVPMSTDKPETKVQKDLMRQTMIQAIQGMSGQNAVSRVPILQAYRDAAANQGLSKDRLQFLDAAIQDAKRFEASAPAPQELPAQQAAQSFQPPPGP